MTGYGSASRPVSLGAGVVADLQVECRAVNSRFLDLGFRLPDECRGAEPLLREMATQAMARGKVEFRAAWRINASNPGASPSRATSTLNPERLAALKALQSEVLNTFPQAGELRIADVLRWPGVVNEPRGEEEGWIGATAEAAKAALEASVRYLAAELGPDKNVRVNAISAGPIRTLASSAIGGILDMIHNVEAKAPLRRTVTQEEVGSTAAFLASPLASGITGQVIYVDAGYCITGM